MTVVKASDALNGTYKFRTGQVKFSGSSSSGWVQVEYTYSSPFDNGTVALITQMVGTAVNSTYQALKLINTSKSGFKVGFQSSSSITTEIPFVYFAIGS